MPATTWPRLRSWVRRAALAALDWAGMPPGGQVVLVRHRDGDVLRRSRFFCSRIEEVVVGGASFTVLRDPYGNEAARFRTACVVRIVRVPALELAEPVHEEAA